MFHGKHMSWRLAHANDATDFVKVIPPILYGPSCDPQWIFNIDQTPVFSLMYEKYTLNEKGARTTVNVPAQ